MTFKDILYIHHFKRSIFIFKICLNFFLLLTSSDATVQLNPSQKTSFYLYKYVKIRNLFAKFNTWYDCNTAPPKTQVQVSRRPLPPTPMRWWRATSPTGHSTALVWAPTLWATSTLSCARTLCTPLQMWTQPHLLFRSLSGTTSVSAFLTLVVHQN